MAKHQEGFYNIPRNPNQGAIADFLRNSRSNINAFGYPFGLPEEFGLGDMFMAQSPEYFDDLSHGMPFVEASGHGGRLDTRLGDVLGLPLPYAGAGKIAQVLGKQGLKKLKLGDNKAIDLSRRKFNQGLAATGLATATGLTSIKVAKGLLDAAPTKTGVTAKVAQTVARGAGDTIFKGFSPMAIKVANLIGTSSYRKELAQAFKDDGFEGLKKAFVKHEDINIEFPDSYLADIDPDDVIDIVSIPRNFIDRNFADSIAPIKNEFLEQFSKIDDDFDFQYLLAKYMDKGYDPKDLVNLVRHRSDLGEEISEYLTKITKKGQSRYLQDDRGLKYITTKDEDWNRLYMELDEAIQDNSFGTNLMQDGTHVERFYFGEPDFKYQL